MVSGLGFWVFDTKQSVRSGAEVGRGPPRIYLMRSPLQVDDFRPLQRTVATPVPTAVHMSKALPLPLASRAQAPTHAPGWVGHVRSLQRAVAATAHEAVHVKRAEDAPAPLPVDLYKGWVHDRE